jgi:hypothetical protein
VVGLSVLREDKSINSWGDSHFSKGCTNIVRIKTIGTSANLLVNRLFESRLLSDALVIV